MTKPLPIETGKAVATEFLAHHGIKGMKWGVRRKDPSGPSSVVISDKRKKVTAKGGSGHAAHPDAIKVASLRQKGKASGLKALSNEELQALQTRLNLESNVRGLESRAPQNPAKKFAKELIAKEGKTQVQSVAHDVASDQVKKMMIKKGLKVAAKTAAAAAV